MNDIARTETCQQAPSNLALEAMQKEAADGYRAEQKRRQRMEIFGSILAHRPELSPEQAADAAAVVYGKLR